MARTQEFNNGQRQVINTIEDTSKYQTGDSRRLRVVADPLRIMTNPKETQLAQLTEALGTIKPQLMDWAVNRQAESYKQSIELGKRKAQTGEVAQGEMEQYGYDNVKAVNDWTDWNQQVLQEYEQGFDKENGDIEAFMKDKWETHPFTDKSENYLSKFTPLAGKTMAKLREAQGVFKATRQEELNNVELTRMFKADISDVMGAGQDYGVSQYEARRANLKAMFPGKTNSQLDELAYQAVLATAEETGDTSLFKVFKQPHADKTPGLYEIPKWKDKIDSEVHRILADKVAKRSKTDSDNEKALKVAADTKEREIMFKLIDANTFEDPTVRAEKIREITAESQKVSESGIPISDGILSKLLTASTGIDKKQETAYQSQNYVTLRLGNPSNQQIAKAYYSGDISQTAFDKLMTKKEEAARRAEKGSTEKPISSDLFVKSAMKSIEANAGYSPFNMTKDGEEARSNANAVKARVLDYIEDLVDSGVSKKDAAAQGEELGIKMLKESGLSNKAVNAANSKIDAVEAKKKNPVAFYGSNLTEFVNDTRNGAVPAMPPKDLLELQRKAKAQAIAEKKLKRHESTK